MQHRASLVALLAGLAAVSSAQDLPYQPCPLIRAYYPVPGINKSSSAIQKATATFSGLFDNLVKTGCSDNFGCISPNTTSFSLALYSIADAGDDEDFIFFDYSHTVPSLANNKTVGLDTIFPTGTLTQVFTVYAWLIQMGDGYWEQPITVFLPELLETSLSSGSIAVDWDNVSIGSLAGQMSGIVRDSYACQLGSECNHEDFITKIGASTPYALPDTTPIISNAAFQLLAFAIERSGKAKCKATSFDAILSASFLQPLNMTRSGLLTPSSESQVFGGDFHSSSIGEPAGMSLLSTTRDLARAGRAMMKSKLISASATRRWLQPIADTSNLRNGVGRPWEIYHAGQYANSTVLDVFTKNGYAGAYASYFGLSPDLGAGFAILSHDTSGTAADLNAYADIVSLALLDLEALAAAEAAAYYSGNYTGQSGNGDTAVIQSPSDGYGFVVADLVVDGIDLRNQTAFAANIELENLDFRIYPSNVVQGTKHLFVAVFQDKKAPVDADTPTCITWQEVGSLGQNIADQFIFDTDSTTGFAQSLSVLGRQSTLMRGSS
ncbi:alkaline D-peptidase [Sporothrix schenckii 1099-18]|nr:alkaline D-peptidase [Sporothrix schenckii 1099-18]KJR83623.1 alkaline D-peptidase [Sporothrix schenckii 1099-18]